jgi:hypothetical protein
MNSRKKYSFFLDVATDLTLAFTDLPVLIANAVRKTDEKKISDSWLLGDLKVELANDVRQGRLVVYHPETLAAYSPPVLDDDLNSSVIIPALGLVPYLGRTRGVDVRLKSHGLGPDYWTFENAAESIQKAASWDDRRTKEFLSHLLSKVHDGVISAFEPSTLKQYDQPLSKINSSIDLVNTQDVWDCFCLNGFMDEYADDFE